MSKEASLGVVFLLVYLEADVPVLSSVRYSERFAVREQVIMTYILFLGLLKIPKCWVFFTWCSGSQVSHLCITQTTSTPAYSLGFAHCFM